MSDPLAPRERLTALLHLLQTRQPARAALPPLEPAQAFVIQHLDEIEPARFAGMIAVVEDSDECSNGQRAPGDELALRLLLEEYAAAVRRLRVVASATGLVLERAAITIKDGQKVVRRYARPQAAPPR